MRTAGQLILPFSTISAAHTWLFPSCEAELGFSGNKQKQFITLIHKCRCFRLLQPSCRPTILDILPDLHTALCLFSPWPGCPWGWPGQILELALVIQQDGAFCLTPSILALCPNERPKG